MWNGVFIANEPFPMGPSGATTAMGSGYAATFLNVITMFIGLLVIIVPAKKSVKSAVLLGMRVAQLKII